MRLHYALRDALAEQDRLRDEVKRQGYEIAKMRHPAEQYDRLADYVIANGLWRGHEGSHTDSILRQLAAVEAVRDRYREDAERWRWFVHHGTFWRGPRCIQFGGEAVSEVEGGPGQHDLKRRAMDAMADEGRAASEGE